jgi:uncharacterized protein with gpF-like domain
VPTDTELAIAKLEAARALQVRVARSVDPIVAALVQAYARAWQQVRGELMQAIAEGEATALLTGQPGVAGIRTMRLQRALDQLTRELQALDQLAGVQVSGAVAAVATAPGHVLEQLLRLSGLAAPGFSDRALQRLIQRASGAITSDYLALSRDAQEALREALVRGMVNGQGPRDVARSMVDRARQLTAARYGLTPEQVDDLRRAGVAEDVVGAVDGAFAGHKNRALVIARTELVDASRGATNLSYVQSGMVVGWRWLCAMDRRTCPACWGMHNTVVMDPSQFQNGHQQCRCAQVPVLAGEELAASDLGDPDQLLRQALHGPGADTLLQSFGPQRIKYLQQGGSVRDLAVLRENPGWRPAYVVKPIRELLAA